VASVDAVTVKGLSVSFSVYGLGDPMVEIEPLGTNIKIDFTSDAATEQLNIDTTETFYENDVEINIDDI
jgi:hypothetical protein